MKQTYYNNRICPPSSVFCLPNMMYVEGNPMSFTDSSGHSIDLSWFHSLVEQFIAGPSPELVFASQFVKGKGARAIQDWALVNAVEKIKSGENDFGLGGLVETFGATNVASMIYIMDSRMGLGKRIRDAYSNIGRSFDHTIKGMMRGMTGSAREIGRAMDGGARWIASGGNYSRNKGNDLDHFFTKRGIINTNGFFGKHHRGGSRLWEETQEARDLAGLSDIKNGGVILGTLADITGITIFASIGKVVGIVSTISFVFKSCSGQNGVFCDVSGR